MKREKNVWVLNVPNEVWGLLYLNNSLWVRRHIHWASWAYMIMRPTWTVCTCVGINSKSRFCLSEWDDLHINLGPLEKRNPVQSSSPSNELSQGGIWPLFPIVTLSHKPKDLARYIFNTCYKTTKALPNNKAHFCMITFPAPYRFWLLVTIFTTFFTQIYQCPL